MGYADDVEIFPAMDKREQAIRRRVHRLAEFYQHLVTFIVVISLVWIGNAFLVYGSERAIKLERVERQSVTGPTSLALPDATMYVAEGWTATTLPIGGWMLEKVVAS